jgi:hypothetical protein
MVRIRTINSAVEEIRRSDPATAVTPYLVRRLVENGAVRSISDGAKKLVDYDSLLNYLEGGGDHEDIPDGS